MHNHLCFSQHLKPLIFTNFLSIRYHYATIFYVCPFSPTSCFDSQSISFETANPGRHTLYKFSKKGLAWPLFHCTIASLSQISTKKGTRNSFLPNFLPLLTPQSTPTHCNKINIIIVSEKNERKLQTRFPPFFHFLFYAHACLPKVKASRDYVMHTCIIFFPRKKSVYSPGSFFRLRFLHLMANVNLFWQLEPRHQKQHFFTRSTFPLLYCCFGVRALHTNE